MVPAPPHPLPPPQKKRPILIYNPDLNLNSAPDGLYLLSVTDQPPSVDRQPPSAQLQPQSRHAIPQAVLTNRRNISFLEDSSARVHHHDHDPPRSTTATTSALVPSLVCFQGTTYVGHRRGAHILALDSHQCKAVLGSEEGRHTTSAVEHALWNILNDADTQTGLDHNKTKKQKLKRSLHPLPLEHRFHFAESMQHAKQANSLSSCALLEAQLQQTGVSVVLNSATGGLEAYFQQPIVCGGCNSANKGLGAHVHKTRKGG